MFHDKGDFFKSSYLMQWVLYKPGIQEHDTFYTTTEVTKMTSNCFMEENLVFS